MKSTKWMQAAVVASIMTISLNNNVYSKTIGTNNSNSELISGLSKFSLADGQGQIEVVGNKLKISNVGQKGLFTRATENVENSESEILFNVERDGANIGLVFRYTNPQNYVAITVQSGGGGGQWPGAIWRLRIPGKNDITLFSDYTKVHGGRTAPCKIKVRLVGQKLTIYFDGAMMYEGEHKEIPVNSGKNGFLFMGSNGSVDSFTTREAYEMQVSDINEKKAISLKNKEMTVRMDRTFPRVLDYKLNKSGNILKGDTEAYNYVDINGTIYVPKITVKKKWSLFSNINTITYNVAITKEFIGSFDVRYTIQNNVLTMEILNATDNIKTVNFPNNHLISMEVDSPNAKLTTTNMEQQKILELAKQPVSTIMNYTRIPVLSNDNIAATMTNNSFKGPYQVAYQIYTNKDGKKYVGLSNNEFVLQYFLDDLLGVKTGNNISRVAIVADVNKDGKVDCQDGLVAYRDNIQFKLMDNELVKNNSFSVAMNVGSIAQYPFLRILDNVKKMSLLTDGFGQAIIIKGYQDEGHDAAHPDYANYNERAGGLQDFKTLLEEAPKYGGNIGIHINHSEVYPEAKQFNAIKTQTGAWSWYDSAMTLDRTNDILDTSPDGMAGRLEQLSKDTLLNDGKTPGIKFVYVDTYFEKRWAAKKLADKLNELGWPVGTENLPNFPGRSMFAHHAESPFHTKLVRYIHNNDIAYISGGTLFRGTTDGGHSYRSGINGWQRSWNLQGTLEEFYKNVLPGKYLQHFPIMEWDNFGDTAKLGAKKEVETTGRGDANIIKKDGKIIANGNNIFIPWDPQNETKIYHYNLKGGTSTWEVPNSWNTLQTVYIYKLTDIGRVEEQKLAVIDGKVTIDAKAKTPYIVYKTPQATPTAAEMKWGEGAFIKDGGFDSHTWNYGWTKSSATAKTDHIQFVNNQNGNTIVTVTGKDNAVITQQITGLESGKKYSASVWMLISEGHTRKSTIQVKAGAQTFGNYMEKSDFNYGHTHNDKLNTKWQRIDVDFVQPQGTTTAELQFTVAASDIANSSVSFDNARVVQIDWTDAGKNYFYEDFESFREGFGPFVSNSTDNSHLSEKLPEATTVRDVIAGTFSLKIRQGNYMRTLPHTLRFLPNKTYKVSILSKNENDSAMREGAFVFAAKTTVGNKTIATEPSVANAANQVGTTTITFTTEEYTDVYIDITTGLDKNYILDNLIVEDISE